MAEVTRIYQDKIVVYENIDDEYQWIARDNYQKYTDSRDSYRDAKIMANQAMDDFGLGALAGIWDMLVDGAVSDTPAKGFVTYAFCDSFGLKTPAWAKEQIEGSIKSYEAMEKNPLLLAEGIAQGASDALEQKGICYCAGYIIGPILATKGITKGIEKLRVAYSARQASKALKAEEVAMQGLDDLTNPAVNSLDDVGRGAADIVDDMANSAGDVGRVAESSSTSWFNPDGSMNYPPNNGAVLGTEKVISLQPGDTLGRYGNIGEKSNFVTQTGADPSKLSLPPNTDASVYQEFVIVKEIPNTVQAEIAAWGGSPGGGLQYELPMPIKQLIKEGYIVPK